MIKLKFYCKEHGFVPCGFGTEIEEVHFNQHGELGRWCPKCIKARPMIIVRWTGQVDKNDVEIYEGDIMVEYFKAYFSTDTPQPGTPFAVEWWEHGFFENRLLRGNYGAERCEIIGNIYENPELLSE